MLVTLWRHGEAGTAATDELRPLTPRGSSSVQAAVADWQTWVKEQALAAADVIWHSPLVRTTQTAQLLEQCLNCARVECGGLAPGAMIDKPASFLPDSGDHVVLVTHQPFVSQLIWYWLDDDALAPLMPGGWASLRVTAPSRGGASLVQARASIFE